MLNRKATCVLTPKTTEKTPTFKKHQKECYFIGRTFIPTLSMFDLEKRIASNLGSLVLEGFPKKPRWYRSYIKSSWSQLISFKNSIGFAIIQQHLARP